MMKRHPVCIQPSTDVFNLASIFVTHGYRHLPVVEGKELVGIVSRRDILKALDSYYRQTIAQVDKRRGRVDPKQLINLRFLLRAG